MMAVGLQPVLAHKTHHGLKRPWFKRTSTYFYFQLSAVNIHQLIDPFAASALTVFKFTYK